MNEHSLSGWTKGTRSLNSTKRCPWGQNISVDNLYRHQQELSGGAII